VECETLARELRGYGKDHKAAKVRQETRGLSRSRPPQSSPQSSSAVRGSCCSDSRSAAAIAGLGYPTGLESCWKRKPARRNFRLCSPRTPCCRILRRRTSQTGESG
jgi:hypothetical protein